MPKYKGPNPFEVGPLKVPGAMAQAEVTIDDIIKKFGPVVKWDPAVPLAVMEAVKRRLSKIIQHAAIIAIVRKRT